jgi:hypothetical protein
MNRSVVVRNGLEDPTQWGRRCPTTEADFLGIGRGTRWRANGARDHRHHES